MDGHDPTDEELKVLGDLAKLFCAPERYVLVKARKIADDEDVDDAVRLRAMRLYLNTINKRIMGRG